MKIHLSSRRNQAFRQIDAVGLLIVVIILFVIFLAIVLPVQLAARRGAQRMQCVKNLKEIGLALRVWEGDNPNGSISFSATNNDMLALDDGQRAWIHCLGISNLLASSKNLLCPADKETPAFSLSGVNIRISYFLNLDASEKYPQMLLSGDDNLAIENDAQENLRPVFIPMKPGILNLTTNTPIAWTRYHHGYVGNVGFADGSVEESSTPWLRNALQNSLQGTPFSTNRLAIP